MKTSLARIAVGCSALLPLICPSTGAADVLGTITDLNAANAPVTYGGTVVDNVFVPGSSPTLPPGNPGQNLGSFGIVIVPGAGLAANAPALAAFQRAANAWAARIADPITITINADLAPLGAGIIGSTSSVFLQAGYNTVRNQIVTDAADEADDGIMASTPTAAQFSANMPAGRTLSGNLAGTKANLKALGFAGLDGTFGVSDGSITFSSSFSFDFDNANGVTAGTMDFETVAAHEIGHALGFVSVVDSIIAGQMSVSPSPLDLLRFRNGIVGQDPGTAGEFTTFARSLVGGVDAITDAINDPEWRMSTGVSGAGTDGNQASHWKANELTSTLIGLMDPTLAFGEFYGPMDPDFRALDLIGYDIAPVPEPTSLSLLLLGGVAAAVVRRRQV